MKDDRLFTYQRTAPKPGLCTETFSTTVCTLAQNLAKKPPKMYLLPTAGSEMQKNEILEVNPVNTMRRLETARRPGGIRCGRWSLGAAIFAVAQQSSKLSSTQAEIQRRLIQMGSYL